MPVNLPYPYPDPSTGEWDGFALWRNLQFLASFVSVGGAASQVQNLQGTATTGQSTLALTADFVSLRDADGDIHVDDDASATLNIATAGPAVNGRDQSGNFQSAWIYIYWIWNGHTVATTASTIAPPTGPTLPSGYTHWAYASTIRVGATANQWNQTVRVSGSKVYYAVLQLILNNGAATVETAVDTSGSIPPNASHALLLARISGASDASGNWQILARLRWLSGSNYWDVNNSLTGLGASQSQTFGGYFVWMPNVSQNFYYILTVNNGSSPAFNVLATGYSVPNGDN